LQKLRFSLEMKLFYSISIENIANIGPSIILLPSELILFFFLMSRRPTNFTLFPYTTLFRSLVAALFLDDLHQHDLPALQDPGSQDRKSTRLNSSHVKKSYAVFCLKKKKYASLISSMITSPNTHH